MTTAQDTGLFIGGVGRSGTTLFADMPGLHSRLSPVYETEFVLAFLSAIRSGELRNVHEAVENALKGADPLPTARTTKENTNDIITAPTISCSQRNTRVRRSRCSRKIWKCPTPFRNSVDS